MSFVGLQLADTFLCVYATCMRVERKMICFHAHAHACNGHTHTHLAITTYVIKKPVDMLMDYKNSLVQNKICSVLYLVCNRVIVLKYMRSFLLFKTSQ